MWSKQSILLKRVHQATFTDKGAQGMYQYCQYSQYLFWLYWPSWSIYPVQGPLYPR